MIDLTVTVTPGIIGEQLKAIGFDIARAAFEKHSVTVSEIVRRKSAS